MTASIFVILLSSPVLRASRGGCAESSDNSGRASTLTPSQYYPSSLSLYYGVGRDAFLELRVSSSRKPRIFLNQDRLTLPFRGTVTEIETIYRAYQVLLLNESRRELA